MRRCPLGQSSPCACSAAPSAAITQGFAECSPPKRAKPTSPPPSVALPRSEFLDQSRIRTVCTRVQFAAEQCPKGAIYGHVKATTPLLDEPLEGPVYLRSSDNELPDAVGVLRGPPHRPIMIEVSARIDSFKRGIRANFEAVPDAPVSKVVVSMRGGAKGLLINSANLCKLGRRGRSATVRMVGQNGKRHDTRAVLRNDCKKKRASRKPGSAGGAEITPRELCKTSRYPSPIEQRQE